MIEYPPKAELENYQSRLPSIKQKGPYWCIPASIENMLKYFGIHNINQEELVLLYCRHFGNDSLVFIQNKKPYTLKIDGMDDARLIESATSMILRHANFGTFKDAVYASGNFDTSKYELLHITDIQNEIDYLELLKTSISSQEPVLIASTNDDGNSHIRVALAYDTNNIILYDPAFGRLLEVSTSDIKFNSDMLVLKLK